MISHIPPGQKDTSDKIWLIISSRPGWITITISLLFRSFVSLVKNICSQNESTNVYTPITRPRGLKGKPKSLKKA